MRFERDPTLRPESPEEKVLWHCILWTYGYYVLGALYVLGPVVGWWLTVRLARRNGLSEVPAVVWGWVVGMLVLLVTLVVAYADFGMGMAPMIKSAVGWAKGWGLIAAFMMVGCGNVRLELLARAASLLGLQTLYILPVLVVAWIVGLPGHWYVSPVSMVGGPGPEYFAFELFGINPENGSARWRLFAPWAPAIGLVMAVYFFIALNEKDLRLRLMGMAGMILAILLSGSRLGLLALPITAGIAGLLRQLGNPKFYFYASPFALVLGFILQPVTDLVDDAVGRFHAARADSSRVRAALGRIALQRWQTEAPLWGHGTVERGPHLVEYMPIGSHHTWFGLLFVKGVIGAAALAVPMLWSLWVLLRGCAHHASARTALYLLVLLFLYTFAENLEILAYLYWPGLVVMGMALRDSTRQAYADPASNDTPEPSFSTTPARAVP